MYTFRHHRKCTPPCAVLEPARRSQWCATPPASCSTRAATARLLVDGKTWTGFANAEEQFADGFVGMRIQPFWIEDEARKLANTNYIVNGLPGRSPSETATSSPGSSSTPARRRRSLVIEALGV